MPKRTDLKKILLIGSGPIIIGQACEFDYSGTQACKALREEGYNVVLVNSNPATIMTDPETADRTYIEPITWEVVAKIIAKERPDALLPTLGGQTGLNTAMDLHKHGVLEKYGVEMIGASADVIDKAEDRAEVQGRDAQDRPRRAEERRRPHRSPRRMDVPRAGRPAVRAAAELHAGRHRRRHRLQPRGVHRPHRPRPRPQPRRRGADRGIGHRLEGVRAGGDARQGRQRRHHLLHREPRPDGRPHRRLASPSPRPRR